MDGLLSMIGMQTELDYLDAYKKFENRRILNK